MSNCRIGSIMRHLHRLATPHHPANTPDRGPLERLIVDWDEAAFAGLVRRQGPMVLGIYRRVPRHAEDAFQAAFLVLAGQAASVRKADPLASWLHNVAYRVAANLKRDVARRRPREATRAGRPWCAPYSARPSRTRAAGMASQGRGGEGIVFGCSKIASGEVRPVGNCHKLFIEKVLRRLIRFPGGGGAEPKWQEPRPGAG
jgi:hypothetical protein